MAERALPKAFDAAGEVSKVLAKAKQALVKKFRWNHAQSLHDAGSLAVLLHVYRRDEEALEICQALGEYEFDGKSYQLWSPVEKALTLASRLLRAQKKAKQAAACVERVRAAGFVEDRLAGSMLDRNGAVAESVRTNDKKWEQQGRLGLAKELAFIIELGGSPACPVAKLETDWQQNLDRLRELTGDK